MTEATPMTEAAESPAASRRTVLCGAAAVLAAGGTVAVAGCASSAAPSSAKSKTPAAPKPPVVVGPAAEVPVGGGKVYREQRIVVTQPTAGEWQAFSAVCTHAGCVVDKVEDKLIKCPCHDSTFNLATGAREAGPAPKPLPRYQVVVEGENLKVTPTG